MTIYTAFTRMCKEYLDFFERYMAILGVFGTVENVKELFTQEMADRYNLKSRIAILFIYLFHIVALMLAIALVGEYLLSASMVSLLVNMTTLLNDLYELFQETYFNHKRKRELSELKAELENHNVTYEQNMSSEKAIFFTGNLEKNKRKTKRLDKKITEYTFISKKDVKQDFDKLYKIANRINDLNIEIQLSSLEEKHKLWSTYISAISAILSISLSYFSLQLNVMFESVGKLTDVVEGLSKLFSILGAVTGLVASSNKNIAVMMRQYEKHQQAHVIKNEFRKKVNIITDVGLRRECDDILSSEEKCEEQSNVTTYLPSKKPKQRRKTFTDYSMPESHQYQFSM